MKEQYIAPSKQTPGQQPQKEDAGVTMWTLSYRLKGITFGLAAAGLYCYFYLGTWPKELLIASAVAGYFLGWVIGRFYYTKPE